MPKAREALETAIFATRMHGSKLRINRGAGTGGADKVTENWALIEQAPSIIASEVDLPAFNDTYASQVKKMSDEEAEAGEVGIAEE